MQDLKKQFEELKNKKIALYGLGTETLKLIESMEKEFCIVGLLDGFQSEGFLYDKPIMDIKQCIHGKLDAIIVVARPGSCKAIAKRIGDFCRENGIELMDIRGNNLLENQKKYLSYQSMMEFLQTSMQSKHNHDSSLKMDMFRERLEQIQKDQQHDGYDNRNSVIIHDAYDIGYLFFAPVIADFVIWFYTQVKVRKLSNVWFCARDGYLLKELYDRMDEKQESVYFLTSRIASIRSCVETKEDLMYVDSMKFSGTLEENLRSRFGIDAAACETDENETGVLRFKEAILNSTQQRKNGYKRYIDSLNIKNGDIAFFDFVAKGTTQYFISRLVDHSLVGLYFLQLEPDFTGDNKPDIISFYSKDELNQSAIFDNYYVLETILTCSAPSVIEFDDAGRAVYATETRSQQEIHCSEKVRQGIKDYFEKYIGQCSDLEYSIDKELDEEFLKLIHNVEIKDYDFLHLMIEDPFFHRMTAVTDLL